MITARYMTGSDTTGCYEFMDEAPEKSGECAKPTGGGMENKVRGHRQMRSENQQMDKNPERYRSTDWNN